MEEYTLWIKAAFTRAIKTFAQTFASMITVGACIDDINWAFAASVSTVAMIYSVATSVAGLPELDGRYTDNATDDDE